MLARRSTGVVFRDFLFLTLLGFLAMVIWMLPLINPPAQSSDAVPPGNVVVAITWPEGDTDIDLWVTGPGEITPVGYSNKGGVLFNLLRDDLGRLPDATPLNYENAYSRGVVAGEYIVNIHCFRCPVLPQKVDVEISVNDGRSRKAMKPVATTSVELRSHGQEKTALRFRLDDKGRVEPASMNNVFRPLRAAS